MQEWRLHHDPWRCPVIAPREWLKRDPYLANKLVTNYRIREWCVVPLE